MLLVYTIDSRPSILTLNWITFSENGTNSSEVHLVNSDIRYRYLDTLDLFHDYKSLLNFTENDLSAWIWPKYNPSFNLWVPKLPVFILDRAYSIKVGGNAIKSYMYTPFEHWQNSRFLIRTWTNDPKVNGT